jgi:hypothetical protein
MQLLQRALAGGGAAPRDDLPITFLSDQTRQPSHGNARLDALAARPPIADVGDAPPNQGSAARLQELVASRPPMPNPADVARLVERPAPATMPAIEDAPSSVASSIMPAIADAPPPAIDEASKPKVNIAALTASIIAARGHMKDDRAQALGCRHVNN